MNPKIKLVKNIATPASFVLKKRKFAFKNVCPYRAADELEIYNNLQKCQESRIIYKMAANKKDFRCRQVPQIQEIF